MRQAARHLVNQAACPTLAQVYSLSEQNRFYKQAAAFCLRAVAKHSPELAQAVIDSGCLDSLVTCLEEFDPGVKEASAWTLGYIAGHNAELAQQVVDAGAVPLLVLCVQEPELSLKRISASALSDIAKHTPELAQAVVDAGAVAYLAPLVINQDAKLKRQVCCSLSQIAKHSVDLAEVVVGAEIFPKILTCLKYPDEFVKVRGRQQQRQGPHVTCATAWEVSSHNPSVPYIELAALLRHCTLFACLDACFWQALVHTTAHPASTHHPPSCILATSQPSPHNQLPRPTHLPPAEALRDSRARDRQAHTRTGTACGRQRRRCLSG